jgi:hypothetical protein
MWIASVLAIASELIRQLRVYINEAVDFVVRIIS